MHRGAAAGKDTDMTNATLNGTNRIADHLGNGKTSTEPVAGENYVGKIVFVEAPIAIFGSGEYIVVEQTQNALYGVKLGTAFDGHEVKQIPLTGKCAWTIVRAEPDTAGLTESTILLLSDFAATPRENRVDLEDCIYEGAEYAAGALMRMLQRRYDGYLALLDEIEKRAVACRYGTQPAIEVRGDSGRSGKDDRQTATRPGDAPIAVLVIGSDALVLWLL